MRKRHVLGGAAVAAVFVAAAAVTVPANAIVGGGKAEPVAWAVQVYDVRAEVGDVYQCTGTLVAPTWVLTAQRCLADAGETTAVRVGSNDLGGGTRIPVDRSEVRRRPATSRYCTLPLPRAPRR
jgi:secreted trypsin-like serine protease